MLGKVVRHERWVNGMGSCIGKTGVECAGAMLGLGLALCVLVVGDAELTPPCQDDVS
jgi:hypothetical protein